MLFRVAARNVATRSVGVWRTQVRWFSLPEHTKLTLPALSPTMSEGTIATWLKQEGDALEAGQPICEIETDKATVDFEVQDDGFLAKILVPAGGSPLPVGSVIGVVVEDKSDVAAFANVSLEELGGSPSPSPSSPKQEEKPPKKQQQAPSPPAVSTPPSSIPLPSSSPSGSRVFASPLAKLIAAEKGLDLSQVKGTGPNGRIIRADVEEFVASGAASASTTAAPQSVAASAGGVVGGDGYFDVPVSSDAQILAQQLEKSKKEIPHYYLNSEIDITALLETREKLNKNLDEESKVAVNDFIIRAAALAMARVPDVNASWGTTFIRKYKNADINVAVINQDESAIIMPVIRAANNKGLAAISQESRAFVSSQESDLDFGVGTFTISNLGAFGLKTFTPIVREPQACSLGVGAISKRAVPDGVNEDGKPNVKVVTSLTVTLSCDHRVVDGAVGAQWLQEFKHLLQNPLSMLL